ncbi:unnamed protein product [Polarella glacialis]|uniref:Uncharacterized protein n=2 Tax=Polarella glacialis TaxID=89957 RepID=A0A813ENI0_POLGL|nr:unnamed protein product [Polarella glacialis]
MQVAQQGDRWLHSCLLLMACVIPSSASSYSFPHHRHAELQVSCRRHALKVNPGGPLATDGAAPSATRSAIAGGTALFASTARFRTRNNNNNNNSNSSNLAQSVDAPGTSQHRIQPQTFAGLLEGFTRLFPLWTLVAAAVGLCNPGLCAGLGSQQAFQRGISLLMISMGLSLTPHDLLRTLRTLRSSPVPLLLNAGCCFVLMPLLAVCLGAVLFPSNADLRAGLILLGCVSGGQASNLCALLAKGDAALSVVLTLSTTLLGVLATPALVQLLLSGGGSATALVVPAAGALAVLQSTASFVLAPLFSGLLLAWLLPQAAAKVTPFCAPAGIAATLALVAGGAANSAPQLLQNHGIPGISTGFFRMWRVHLASILLPLLGGWFALRLARGLGLQDRAVRTLTIETLVKSPTLAYVLALRHFGPEATIVPAAAMVWLATLGALTAAVWARILPPDS